MKTAMTDLLGSKKFLVTMLAVIAMAGFVYAGKLTVDQFMSYVDKLVMLLVGALAVEKAAANWNSPPPGTVNVPISEISVPAKDSEGEKK